MPDPLSKSRRSSAAPDDPAGDGRGGARAGKLDDIGPCGRPLRIRRRSPQLLGDGGVPRVGRGRERDLGAEDVVEQKIADECRSHRSAQMKMTVEAELRGGSRKRSAEVRLAPGRRDDEFGTAGNRFGENKVELTHLVAAERVARHVLALHAKTRDPQGGGELRRLVERRRQAR